MFRSPAGSSCCPQRSTFGSHCHEKEQTRACKHKCSRPPVRWMVGTGRYENDHRINVFFCMSSLRFVKNNGKMGNYYIERKKFLAACHWQTFKEKYLRFINIIVVLLIFKTERELRFWMPLSNHTKYFFSELTFHAHSSLQLDAV